MALWVRSPATRSGSRSHMSDRRTRQPSLNRAGQRGAGTRPYPDAPESEELGMHFRGTCVPTHYGLISTCCRRTCNGPNNPSRTGEHTPAQDGTRQEGFLPYAGVDYSIQNLLKNPEITSLAIVPVSLEELGHLCPQLSIR